MTSHSTWTPLEVCPPRCCLKCPSLVLRTISSNQGAPRAAGSGRTTDRMGFWRAGPAKSAAVSSSLLSWLGRKPSSPSRSWSESKRLPTVRQMCSASSCVRSFHDESCVPQYPQKTRRWSEVKGETKERWMLDRVSSGYCAKVADVYHGSGTRSHNVSGLAELCPKVAVSYSRRVVRLQAGRASMTCMVQRTQEPQSKHSIYLREADVLSYRSSACCACCVGISTT
jgi:hypothetical protein